MVVLGLTGSIGMGKSTAARMFRYLGLPVHDADAAVHRLLSRGGAAVAEVEAAFPGVAEGGAIDRTRLGERVFNDPAALRRLESILHPRVRREARRFLKLQRRHRRPAVVLDIPLLFETGGEGLCDYVVVVTAPRFLQEIRVLRRPGMTRARLDDIRARQMPDAEKRRRADFLVPTGLGKGDTLRRLARVVRLAKRHPLRRRRPRQPRPTRKER